MWANIRIIVLLNALKVGSLRTRQMLKVDLCANGADAYAPYAPPLPAGLDRIGLYMYTCTGRKHLRLTLGECSLVPQAPSHRNAGVVGM